MENDRSRELKKINYLTSELDSLYHQANLKLGIADSVSLVLYTIYDSGDGCLLSDVYHHCGISKQTVSSAIRHLEADGILYLEQHDGRSKKIVLTEKGKGYVQKTAARLYGAEVDALGSWEEDEISAYIRLMEKHAASLRHEIEKI